jgi:hypothetical protein
MNYLKKATLLLFIVTFLLSLPFSTLGQTSISTNQDSVFVSNTLNEFINVFKNLEWNKFIQFFDTSVTAFFPPSAKISTRANNKNEVGNIFMKVFENAKKNKSIPPYLDINPKDLKIQLIDSTAIVTFHLEDPDLFGRRTIIFHKAHNKWLIVHLHASGVNVHR